ncbi:VOC family protein [Actinopolymorpha sp. B11F2]|uniref:VOC family protein n=1 Tax=Actinopolymorpha sp. B11F2 TaxID=3160862 RepID=UPI0032E47949
MVVITSGSTVGAGSLKTASFEAEAPAQALSVAVVSAEPDRRVQGAVGMRANVQNLIFDCPDARTLASFYAELVLMPIRHLDTPERVVIGNDKSCTRLAFATVDDFRPPTWPDPAYPQQLHLCGPAAAYGYDAESPTDLVQRLGAIRLPDLGGDCPVYADPAGHPFCLCAGFPPKREDKSLRGYLGGVVFDCFDSPRALAAFYAELLDMPERMEDEEGWVTIKAKDRTRPGLGFQGANGKQPQWLDPECPPQLHLDIEVDDLAAAENLVARLGATRLPDMGAEYVVYADPEGHPFCLYPAG